MWANWSLLIPSSCFRKQTGSSRRRGGINSRDCTRREHQLITNSIQRKYLQTYPPEALQSLWSGKDIKYRLELHRSNGGSVREERYTTVSSASQPARHPWLRPSVSAGDSVVEEVPGVSSSVGVKCGPGQSTCLRLDGRQTMREDANIKAFCSTVGCVKLSSLYPAS